MYVSGLTIKGTKRCYANSRPRQTLYSASIVNRTLIGVQVNLVTILKQ